VVELGFELRGCSNAELSRLATPHSTYYDLGGFREIENSKP
jgi:hypothetical protein